MYKCICMYVNIYCETDREQLKLPRPLHTCIDRYIQTYTHTYIHTYTHTRRRRDCLRWCPTR